MAVSPRTPLRHAAALAAALALAAPAAAQSIATLMKIDGLPGDSTIVGHANEIVLEGYSQTIGTRNCSRVVATKQIDRASPGLVSRAAAGTVTPQVVITLARLGAAGVQDFFRAQLDQVTIERLELGEQYDSLVERVVMAPRSIRIEYRPQNADGSLGAPIATAFTCP